MSRWALVLFAVGACIEPWDGQDDVGVVTAASVMEGAQITWYTLVTEAETSGQHTGDTSVICNANGLTGCYHREFLCSGWGVAMQGTGISNYGQYVKYVSGGGGWTSGYRSLRNCATARFRVVNTVTGSTGRILIEGFSCAVDPNRIRLGSYIWIESEQRWCRADDTGGAIRGNHIDIYRGRTGATAQSSTSRIFVTDSAHGYTDTSPWATVGPRPDAGTGTTGTGTATGYSCPSDYKDCGNGSCCQQGYPICCPGGMCSRTGWCPSPGTASPAPGDNVQCSGEYAKSCGNGYCCPNSWVCCPNSYWCAAQGSYCP